MASTYELIVKLNDQTTRPSRNIESNLDRLERKGRSVGTALKAAGGALAAFATGSAVRSIVTTTARFEDLQDTLNTVTGSAKDGAKAFDDIKKFATSTQFGVEELTTTFIKLKGSGIEPTKELLTTFTDTAAVTTDQLGTLEAMADLFSRTTAGGLGLEELNRLADRGVPVFRILEEQLGLTRLQISEFGKTAEGADKIRSALQRGLNESFGGATQGKLDNLSTAMSNFGIAVTNAADRIGQQFRPQLTQAINDATNFINENEKLLDALGAGLGQAIVSLAQGISILAQNIDVIRNAILTGIAITGAGSFVTLIKKINQATSGAKSLSGVMSGVGKSIFNIGASIPILGNVVKSMRTLLGATSAVVTKIPGIGRAAMEAARFAPLLANPYILAGAAIGTAIIGAFAQIGAQAAQVAGVNTNAVEVIRAYWFRISNAIQEYWAAAIQRVGEIANNIQTGIVNVWQTIKAKAAEAFKPMADYFRWAVINMLDTAKDWSNRTIGLFVFVFNSVKETFMNLPNLFGAIFSAISTVATNFGASLVEKFGNIGNAIAMAIRAPFTDETFADALALATKDAFGNMDTIIAEELGKIQQSSVDYAKIAGEAFGTDYMGAAGESIKAGALELSIGVGEALNAAGQVIDTSIAAIKDGYVALGTDVANTVTAFREHQELMAQLPAYAQPYEDAILRIANHQLAVADATNAANAATNQQTNETTNATAALSEYEKFLAAITQRAAENMQQTDFTNRAHAELNEQFRMGKITGEQYSAMVQALGISFDNTSSKAVATANSIAAVNTQLSGYDAYLQRITSSANQNANEIGYAMRAKQDLAQQLKDGKISLDAYAQAMQQLNRTTGTLPTRTKTASTAVKTASSSIKKDLEKVEEKAKTTADIIKEGFKSAGDSLTKDLATALRTGRGVMDSFKNYFNRALDSILQSIIEKNITGPLTQQLNGLIDGMMPGGELGGGMVKSMASTTSAIQAKTSTFGMGFKNWWGNLFSGITNMFGGFGSGLTNLFSGLFSNIGGMLSNFGSGISGFFGNLFGGGGGFFSSLIGGIGGFASSIFGGIGSIFGFANGGYPPVNRPSIVGEKGPELFVPSTTGRVIPNDEIMGGGGPTQVIFNLNAIDTRSGVEFLLENKPAIINMVQQASNKRGKAGILD